MKWIKREKLSSPLYSKGIFYRKMETFDYIIDVEVERIEEIKKKAKEDNYNLTEIDRIPQIFFNPFSEIHSFI
jgi:hypothetical protein